MDYDDPDYASELTRIRSALKQADDALRAANKAVDLAASLVTQSQNSIDECCLRLAAEASMADYSTPPERML